MLPIFFFLSSATIIYLVLASNFSTTPNKLTQDATASLPKYNNAKTWVIENNKTICILSYNNCKNPPLYLRFTTRDNWPTIYNVYRVDMPQYGWHTNSQVFTSIPTSIVFTNANCEVILQEISSKLTNKPEGINQYSFKIVCK